MSGFAGNPDLESEHALIMSENGVEASRAMLIGRVLTECLDCGNTINPKRVEYALKHNMKCEYCIDCQSNHDQVPITKMLTRML